MELKSRRVKALGYGEQRIEALGQSPYLDFELRDGSTVRLPHPQRLDEPALERFEAFRRGDGLDREAVLDADGSARIDTETGRPVTRLVEPHQVSGEPAPPIAVRTMRAVLGDDDYAKLIAHGLTPGELRQIWESLTDVSEPEVVDLPKGKRS